MYVLSLGCSRGYVMLKCQVHVRSESDPDIKFLPTFNSVKKAINDIRLTVRSDSKILRPNPLRIRPAKDSTRLELRSNLGIEVRSIKISFSIL